MPARHEPRAKRYPRESALHIELTKSEMDQLRKLSALHRVPMTKLVRARLRLPLALTRIEQEHGHELAQKMAWRLISDEEPLPKSTYVRQG